MMNDYRRMMEQVTLSDRKKEEIMELLEHKTTRPRKKRMPRAAKLILAAALAAGCALSIAAGLPAQAYQFISGGSITVNPGTDTAYYDRLNAVDPVEVDAGGRVWLTADGQHLDITDKVDENTPYIYERTDEAAGQKGYLIIGGVHDDLGWMEWFQMDGDWFWHAENCLKDASAFSAGAVGDVGDAAIVVENLPDDIVPEGKDSAPAPSDGVSYHTTESEYAAGESEEYTIDFRPWVEAGMEQLAEMGIVQYEPQVD